MNKIPSPPEILHTISLLPLEEQEEIRAALNEQWNDRLNGELQEILDHFSDPTNAPQC